VVVAAVAVDAKDAGPRANLQYPDRLDELMALPLPLLSSVGPPLRLGAELDVKRYAAQALDRAWAQEPPLLLIRREKVPLVREEEAHLMPYPPLPSNQRPVPAEHLLLPCPPSFFRRHLCLFLSARRLHRHRPGLPQQ
jgi:hypothetical protein